MLTHLNEKNQPQMVDITDKEVTKRKASARARVFLPSSIVELFKEGEIQSKKGPVFQTAMIAGTMSAKKTHELIPFCHALPLEDCRIEIRLEESEAIIEAHAKTTARTGVEMEALVAANIAALTIYDMCKAMSNEIEIKETVLIQKTGGKKDYVRKEM